MNINITRNLYIKEEDIEITAIRAQGAGGQNVNKVSSAIHLRFDIKNADIPEFYRERLLNAKDGRITSKGELIIKAQSHRTQQRNRDDAMRRLKDFILRAIKVEKKRIATRPSLGAKRRRLEGKKQKQQKKAMRGKVRY